MNILANQLITRVANAATAATTDVESSVIDMKGYDNCAFIALLGDATSGSVITLTAEAGTATNLSDAVAVSGGSATFTAGATDADNGMLAVEIMKPRKRYLRVTLSRDTQACVVDGILAIQSNAANAPVTQSDGVLDSAAVLSPAPVS